MTRSPIPGEETTHFKNWLYLTPTNSRTRARRERKSDAKEKASESNRRELELTKRSKCISSHWPFDLSKWREAGWALSLVGSRQCRRRQRQRQTQTSRHRTQNTPPVGTRQPLMPMLNGTLGSDKRHEYRSTRCQSRVFGLSRRRKVGGWVLDVGGGGRRRRQNNQTSSKRDTDSCQKTTPTPSLKRETKQALMLMINEASGSDSCCSSQRHLWQSLKRTDVLRVSRQLGVVGCWSDVEVEVEVEGETVKQHTKQTQAKTQLLPVATECNEAGIDAHGE
ncbi:hypothetical protein CPC08DRAFT_806470 [Agrocybe pediades]|nr:hypothetical protein CPC08DRAFT_806470 [Agrocybe pediades]